MKRFRQLYRFTKLCIYLLKPLTLRFVVGIRIQLHARNNRP